jgi:uncharacterized membrane protein
MAKQPTNDHQGKVQLQSSLNFTRTRTDKLAVGMISALGSLTFLLVCIVIFTLWICWNARLIPGLQPFDPFPFATLEMAVSIFAIILSIAVLNNQNRQGLIEKVRQQVEFEINVRAESEITKMLGMLHDIHVKLGIEQTGDQELEQMKQQTDIHEIHHKVDDGQTDTDPENSEKR